MTELGEINVNVRADGVEQASDDIEEAGEQLEGMDGESMAPGGGGGGGGEMLATMKGMLKPLLAIAAVAAILQDTLQVIMQIAQAFIRPLSAMLMRLFMPVLRWFLQLLPLWMDFLSDPAGAIKDGVAAIPDLLRSLPGMVWTLLQRGFEMLLVGVTGALSLLGTLLSAAPGMIWDLVQAGFEWLLDSLAGLPGAIWDFMQDLPKMIWGFMERLPGMIADAIGGAVPGSGLLDDAAGLIPGLQTGGVVTQEGVFRVGEAGPEAVVPLDRLERMLRGQQAEVNIGIGGGISPFISEVTRDPNVDL